MSRQLLRAQAKAKLKALKRTNQVHKSTTMAAFWPIFVATGKMQARLQAAANTSNIQVMSGDELDALDFDVSVMDSDTEDLGEMDGDSDTE